MKFYATKISENMQETPEGYLLCIGVPIARTGDMEYGRDETPLEVGPNGRVIINRSEEEVFRTETIASFNGKPFTIKHPEDFVDPDNWKNLAKGHIQNVRRGEGEFSDSLIADILITDAFAISLVKSGLRGLSCGYEAEYTQTGEGKGIQTNIIGNHLALVEEGRAGLAYAINDEKGVFRMSKKLGDKIKSIFAKAVDEAVKDAETPPSEGKPAVMDDLKKMCDAMNEMGKKINDMVSSMSQQKDEDKDKGAKDEDKEKEGKEKSKDEPDFAALEERLKALEAAVSKILEAESAEAEAMNDEDKAKDEEEEVEVDDEEEESEDEGMTADTKSRAEILAPGLKASAKDVKRQALKTAYATKDGKRIIDQFTAGKAPIFDTEEKADTLFVAASELLKVTRANDLAKTKSPTNDFQSMVFDEGNFMTPEKMNELNQKFYANK